MTSQTPLSCDLATSHHKAHQGVKKSQLPIVIQVRPSHTQRSNSPERSLQNQRSLKSPDQPNKVLQYRKRMTSPPVRSAEEALQILGKPPKSRRESRHQRTPQPPAATTNHCHSSPNQNRQRRNDSTTTLTTSPPVRSAAEALQILENHRNKTQAIPIHIFPNRIGTANVSSFNHGIETSEFAQ